MDTPKYNYSTLSYRPTVSSILTRLSTFIVECSHLRSLRPLFNWPAKFLELPTPFQFFFWLAVVLLLKADSILEPPVWDSAMGAFPPAIYLHENQFNIHGLLQEANWWNGGPNVHSLSLFTWFVAALMTLTDSPTATFAIVHLTTFALFSWSIVLFTQTIVDYKLAPSIVVASALFLILMPLILVQVGFLYTESWVMILGIASWAKFHQGRFGAAVLFCIFGLFIKLTAVAISVCIGASLILRMSSLTLRKIFLCTLLPVAFFAVSKMEHWLGATSIPATVWGSPQEMMKSLLFRIIMIPDITQLVIGGMICTSFLAVRCVARERGLSFLLALDTQGSSRLICQAMPFVFLVGILVFVYNGNLFLPRYIIPMLPFTLVQILLYTHSVFQARAVLTMLIASCLFFAINFNGSFYPANFENFSVAERSHEYRNFHQVQKEAINALGTMPNELPVFVSREIDYMVSSPLMGYVERVMPQINPIYIPPYLSRSLTDFPDDFLLLYSNSGHGGKKIKQIVQEASRSPYTRIQVQNFQRGGFCATLYRIQKNSSL